MKIIDAKQLSAMTTAAITAPRLRTHKNLHDSPSEPIQQVVIAFQPSTYVRPHRHGPGIWEMFALLDGALAVLIFDDDGTLTQRVELRSNGDRIVQLDAGLWHSLVVLEPNSLALEVKPGPYVQTTDKDFAIWAPAEGDEDAAAFVAWMEGAEIGVKLGEDRRSPGTP